MACAPFSCVYGSVVIQQRHYLMIILHIATLNSYNLRTILEEVAQELAGSKEYTAEVDTCPQYEPEMGKEPSMKWSLWITDVLRHSFIIGFTLGQLPGGWLADKIGAKSVIGASTLACATANCFLPLAISKGGYNTIVFVRVVIGLSQGVLFPAIASMLQHWATDSELSLIGGIAFSGISFGLFVSSFTTGYIIKISGDWAAPFYIWPGFVYVWFVFFVFVVFSKPIDHPYITEEELEHFQPMIETKKEFQVPWCKMFTSGPIWALIFSKFTDSYTTSILMSMFPVYMMEILKYDVSQHAFLKSIPVSMWVTSILCSVLTHWLTNKNWWSLLITRKLCVAIGILGAPTCTVIAVYMGCTREGFVIFLLLGWSMKGFAVIGVLLNSNDLSRHYAGTIYGLVNTIATPSFIFQKEVMDHLKKDGRVHEWSTIVWIFFGISAFSTIIFALFGKAERQYWDFPRDADDVSL